MNIEDHNTTEQEIEELAHELGIDESIIRSRIAELSVGLTDPSELRDAAILGMDQIAAEWANQHYGGSYDKFV